MKEVILYMLIAISDGHYNRGTITHIANFSGEDKCLQAVSQIVNDSWISNSVVKCVKSQVLIKE